jgi:RNA polymerase sigma-70 factor (ECF subfamily)
LVRSRADNPRVGRVDSTVLERARQGEREGLAELWRAFQAPLVRYLTTKRMQSPEDVASRVWIDVASSIDRFEGDDDDFRRWFFTIAHRRSVDEVRRSIRHDKLVNAVDDVATADGADDDYESATALNRALTLLRALPPDQAEAIMLKVVNDMPVCDVASVMSTSEGNVRVLVHRGLSRLRRKNVVTKSHPTAMKLVS